MIVLLMILGLGLLSASGDIRKIMRRGWRRIPRRYKAAWRLYEFRDDRAMRAGFDR